MFLRSRVRTKVREAIAPGSDLRHASIDGEIHAGDERTFIGGEERDGSRDFLWLAPATHGNLRGELGGRLLGLLRGKARRLLEGWGLGWSGAHRIHADLAVFQLHSPAKSRRNWITRAERYLTKCGREKPSPRRIAVAALRLPLKYSL